MGGNNHTLHLWHTDFKCSHAILSFYVWGSMFLPTFDTVIISGLVLTVTVHCSITLVFNLCFRVPSVLTIHTMPPFTGPFPFYYIGVFFRWQECRHYEHLLDRLIFKEYLFLFCVWKFYLHSCLCAVPTGPVEGDGSSRTGVTQGCDQPCGCQEFNLGPVKEQPVLLTIVIPLQPFCL